MEFDSNLLNALLPAVVSPAAAVAAVAPVALEPRPEVEIVLPPEPGMETWLARDEAPSDVRLDFLCVARR